MCAVLNCAVVCEHRELRGVSLQCAPSSAAPGETRMLEQAVDDATNVRESTERSIRGEGQSAASRGRTAPAFAAELGAAVRELFMDAERVRSSFAVDCGETLQRIMRSLVLLAASQAHDNYNTNL